MAREWSMSRTAPSTIAPASPWRLPMLAETPPMLEMLATPWTTSTSPGWARLCASMSASPLTLRRSLTARLSTVSAWPTRRARGSVGFSSDAGTAPAMPSSSIASEVVPVRSPSSRNRASTFASSRGSSIMPIAEGTSLPSGLLAIEWAAHHGAALPVIQGAAEETAPRAAARRLRHALPRLRAREPLSVRARAQLHADLRRAQGNAVCAARAPWHRPRRGRAVGRARLRQHRRRRPDRGPAAALSRRRLGAGFHTVDGIEAIARPGVSRRALPLYGAPGHRRSDRRGDDDGAAAGRDRLAPADPY